MIKFQLYVSGKTLKSKKIIENLKQFISDDFKDGYSLEIIDVIENPELAERAKILATPILIKVFPLPVKRILGDFDNKKKILEGLELIKSVR